MKYTLSSFLRVGISTPSTTLKSVGFFFSTSNAHFTVPFTSVFRKSYALKVVDLLK